ncbi:MAG: SDR family oxidoreductase [Acidobacteria bacterium]|nr:SDR family oxidoreductase [Acidobacteriota bacterium]
MPTVFLTGVTGFLGGALLACLLDAPFDGQIVGLVRADDQELAEERVRRSAGRFVPRFAARLPRNLTVLRGDLLARDWHDAPELDGVTHVVHLAANTSFGNQRGIRKTNVEGALSVAQAMQGRRIERYVHTGTATICGAFPPHVVHEDNYPSESATHLVAYTRSKADAERLLTERYADRPLVVARPSIVVGHTQLGCKPSGSIFWVLRAVEALRFITWDPHNRIDVVPVDWAASALTHLLFAPRLKHTRYHVSAGTGSSIRWKELAAEYARLAGEPARDHYEVGKFSQLTPHRVTKAVGKGHARHLLHALELYYRFCSLDLVFDNRRLLKEGVPPPPRFTDYMRVCLESSTSSIYEQMRIDLEPALTLA